MRIIHNSDGKGTIFFCTYANKKQIIALKTLFLHEIEQLSAFIFRFAWIEKINIDKPCLNFGCLRVGTL